MSEKKRMGLLLMAYGTPRKPEDLIPYYTHIRHGRKPSDELIQDLRERYEAIGGISPLAHITEEQVAAIEKRLNEVQSEIEFKAYLGLKHIHPFIEEAVEQMHLDGITEAISLVLAPHYSTFSVKSYNGRAKQKADGLGNLVIHSIDSWYKEPKFIGYWADQLKHTTQQIPDEKRAKTVVIFSAHSLPEKILQMNDPYPEQLQETAELIAKEADIQHYEIGWQSAGNTPDPWLGPDVQDLTRQLHDEKGYTSFIYCPVGFVADHLEVLYDNDIECKVVCDELGADYYRPDMPNTKPMFIDSLVTVIRNQLAQQKH
ncbi:ferrochelatase [Thermoflavimicrobium daqui]|uniref:Coproporphyrin III ferrochelatase n=2 Tax=Thermoflavimicrobium daqui TaxID=2137476 RepID=A0A364K2F2_9BACL|nr:ferrochelatase [Thermoflavimicrobium daqui]